MWPFRTVIMYVHKNCYVFNWGWSGMAGCGVRWGSPASADCEEQCTQYVPCHAMPCHAMRKSANFCSIRWGLPDQAHCAAQFELQDNRSASTDRLIKHNLHNLSLNRSVNKYNVFTIFYANFWLSAAHAHQNVSEFEQAQLFVQHIGLWCWPSEKGDKSGWHCIVSHQLCRGEAGHHFGSALSELLVTLSAALSQN